MDLITSVSWFLSHLVTGSRMSTAVFSRDSLESYNAQWGNMQQQSPFPNHSPSADPLPYPHRIPSPDQPQLRHNTSDQSLNSEMTGADPSPQQPQSRHGDDQLHLESSDPPSTNLEHRARTSSEVTVNNNLDRGHHHKPKPLTTPLPPPPPSSSSQERDSNLFEISEEEMNGGYLARSVIAPGPLPPSRTFSSDAVGRSLLRWHH
jgi:hypothetical protein